MKRLAAFLLSALLIVSASACSQNTQASSKQEETTAEQTTAEQTTQAVTESATTVEGLAQTKVNKLLSDYNMSGVLFVLKDGKPVVSYSGGSFSDGTKITIDSPMAIGSVSKQFCAAAVMKLQEEGKLNISDTLDKYYPEYKEAKRITLHQMLSMTAGIPDFPADREKSEKLAAQIKPDNTDGQNTAAVLDYIFNENLKFEPGSNYEYSNCSYILLGNLVEKVSGQKYIDFLREKFFTPLGMTHTGSLFELGDKPEWAKGFAYKYEDLKFGIEPGLSKGAGDIVSTANDMMLWMDGISSGKAITRESYKQMTTDQADGGKYGYGFETSLADGVGHFGLVGVFTACDYISESEKLKVFFASNSGGGDTLQNRFYELLGALA